MAWSIFDQSNGDQVATAWGVALLQALNLQVTPARLQFVFDWQKSEGGGGKYNPLNQGPVPNNPGLTSTGPQYGGGAADFVNWQAGIQGAVDYLNMPNFQSILRAMDGGDYNQMTAALWNSPWAGGHYGYGSKWNTGNYVPMSPAQIVQVAQQAGFDTNAVLAANAGIGNSGGGDTATGGTISAQGAGNTINGQPLTMADIPQVVQWINQNWPSYSWLMNEPGLAPILEQAAVQGLSPDQVQAKIEQSQWWKTTSTAMRQYEQDRALNPADYSFNQPGSKAAQMYAQISNAAAGFGVMLTPTQIQQLASQALQFGWTSQQIQQAVGKNATPGNAGQVVQQVNAMANQYFQTLSPQMQALWVQQIAEGTRTLPEFQSQMAQQAAMKWTGYSQQLLNGYTMTQLTDNLRQEAAKTMEIDPNSINFTTDPTYQKIIDFAPPVDASKVSQLPQHRVMTLSEMDQYLKGLPQWGSTQTARDQAATLTQTLAQNFGKIPGGTI